MSVFKVFADAGTSARLGSFALLAGTFAAATLTLATPASATVFVRNVTPLDNSLVGTVSGSSQGDPRFYFGMSPYLMTGKEDGQKFSALAFCVQFYVDMAGEWSTDGLTVHVNKDYEDGDLVTLSDGDTDTAQKVYNLVNLGTDLYFAHAVPDLNLQLAAIQGAIWKVMTHQPIIFFDNPDYPELSGHAPDSPLIDHYVSLASAPPPDATMLRTLITRDNSSQAIVYSMREAVPEPATWGLLIVGFFSVGSMLRAGRRRARAAA